jgi:hypothetical protein
MFLLHKDDKYFKKFRNMMKKISLLALVILFFTTSTEFAMAMIKDTTYTIPKSAESYDFIDDIYNISDSITVPNPAKKRVNFSNENNTLLTYNRASTNNESNQIKLIPLSTKSSALREHPVALKNLDKQEIAEIEQNAINDNNRNIHQISIDRKKLSYDEQINLLQEELNFLQEIKQKEIQKFINKGFSQQQIDSYYKDYSNIINPKNIDKDITTIQKEITILSNKKTDHQKWLKQLSIKEEEPALSAQEVQEIINKNKTIITKQDIIVLTNGYMNDSPRLKIYNYNNEFVILNINKNIVQSSDPISPKYELN